ncbi:MAG: hypothetical protein WCK67_02170 [bacterium]
MNFFADFEQFNNELSDNNFFLNPTLQELISEKDEVSDKLLDLNNQNSVETKNNSNPITLNRINDYDSNLINDSLAQHLPTESLKIEFMIEKAEKELKEVDSEIQSIKLMNLSSAKIKLTELENRRIEILDKLSHYKKQYRTLDKFNAISDVFNDLYGVAKNGADNAKTLVFENPISKNFRRSIPMVKKSDDLKEINRKFLFLTGSINRISDKKVAFGSLTSQRNLADYFNEVNKLNKQYSDLIAVQHQKTKRNDNKPTPKILIFFKELRDLVNKTLNG